jgi:hypothetical protein
LEFPTIPQEQWIILFHIRLPFNKFLNFISFFPIDITFSLFIIKDPDIKLFRPPQNFFYKYSLYIYIYILKKVLLKNFFFNFDFPEKKYFWPILFKIRLRSYRIHIFSFHAFHHKGSNDWYIFPTILVCLLIKLSEIHYIFLLYTSFVSVRVFSLFIFWEKDESLSNKFYFVHIKIWTYYLFEVILVSYHLSY